jgi:Calcineurin-like phosphoesterase
VEGRSFTFFSAGCKSLISCFNFIACKFAPIPLQLSETVAPGVTHVVAARDRSDKAIQARKIAGCVLVKPSWLVDCYVSMLRCDAKQHLMRNKSSFSWGTTTKQNSLTVPVTMTTRRSKPIPKILCCSCDESAVNLVRQAFADSPLPPLVSNPFNNMNHNSDHHSLQGEYFQVHHVPTSQQALATLLEHSEDTFSTIIVDDSTWDNGAVFLACCKRRLLPIRIFMDTTVSVTEECNDTSKSSSSYTIPQKAPSSYTKDSKKKHDDNHKTVRCYKMGADVVVPCSVTALQHAHQVLVKRVFGSGVARGSTGSNEGREEQQHHGTSHPQSLQSRYQREAQLQQLSDGRVTRRIRELQRHTERLATCFAKLASTTTTTSEQSTLPTTTRTAWQPHCQLQSPLSCNKKLHGKDSSSLSSASSTSSMSSLRIVHISDTHNFHRKLHLPPGDILLHTGDICGNYTVDPRKRRVTLVDQFQDFLEWIHSSDVYPMYEKIVLLAGNHDTYLDPEKCESIDDYQRAQFLLRDVWRVEVPSHWSMLPTRQHPLATSSQHHHPTTATTLTESSPSKVCYLDQSSIQFRGLTIYGSPTSICRVETKNRRILSNGFERTHIQRQRLWDQIPDKVDILLTHIPPAGIEGADEADSSCEYLTRAVYHQRRRTGRDEGKDKDPDDTLRQLLPKNLKTVRPQSSSTTNINRPPRLHAFGHVHDQFGVVREPLTGTILSNACQEILLRDDLYGGGTPLVFDLPLLPKEGEGAGGGGLKQEYQNVPSKSWKVEHIAC